MLNCCHLKSANFTFNFFVTSSNSQWFKCNNYLINIMYKQFKINYWSTLDKQHGSMADIAWTLQWRHNERDGVSSYRCLDCLLNRLFGRGSMKTSKLRVTGLCERNSPVTGEFPAHRTSYAENVSVWWRHHVIKIIGYHWSCPMNGHRWTCPNSLLSHFNQSYWRVRQSIM